MKSLTKPNEDIFYIYHIWFSQESSQAFTLLKLKKALIEAVFEFKLLNERSKYRLFQMLHRYYRKIDEPCCRQLMFRSLALQSRHAIQSF